MGTEMHVDLDQWLLTNAAKPVNLTGLDDQNVPRARLELLTVYSPEAAALSHELNFIVGVTMGSGSASRQSTQKKYGDVHVAVIGPDELVGAAPERQVFLADSVHAEMLL
jgi:hypothetical protein